jgi:hypothetical protein
MGTDIHGVFQARNKTTGKWGDISHNFEMNRHYMLFAWLGNVRNGRGFAGTPTHQPLIPLSDNRGYPEDFERSDIHTHRLASVEHMEPWRRKYAIEDLAKWDAQKIQPFDDNHPLDYWMGDHSHSWLSADEILTTAPPRLLRTGVLGRATFLEWNGQGNPSDWYGGISGSSVNVYEPASPEQFTDPELFLDLKEWFKKRIGYTHIRAFWYVECADEFKYFIDEVRRLRDEHGEVRFVFGFDS